ncbi:MAG: hypothetical protein H7838_05930 [Magnetococcus sp. DMHC-8]
MTQAVTFADVWKMFQETGLRFQETDRKFQETDRQIQETDRQIQATDRQIQATAAQLKETDRTLRAMLAETDRQIQATAVQMKETDRKLDRLGGRLGEFVEGLVAPACRTLFAQRGIPVHKVSRRVEARLPGGRYLEVDLLVVNGDAVVLVEVKSKLTADDVREHLVRLAAFKGFFPEYADKRVIGAVAGMVMEENVSRFAIHRGLFVIEQAGDTLRLANDEAFVPSAW